MMSKFEEIPRAKWSLAALTLSQMLPLFGCQASLGVSGGDIDGGDGLGDWTTYVSEEDAALSCPAAAAARGVDCAGSFCDDVALFCSPTTFAVGASHWLPFFSEEGPGAADEGHCLDDDMWMTGIHCQGGFCDRISLQCTQLLGSSAGECGWSGWYSEEQAPFYAPADAYIKGIECAGPFCDKKRYRYCEMD